MPGSADQHVRPVHPPNAFDCLAKQFQFELDFADRGPRYNIAPTQEVAAVRLADGKRELAMLHWGLIPVWAKEKKIAFSTINARGDTVATKPAFRSAFKRRRCLVLADGYYEWQRDGKTKLPWLYEVEGGKPFALAGLWEVWHGSDKGDGPPLESCSLITTDANKLAAKVHDRMPVTGHKIISSIAFRRLTPAEQPGWTAEPKGIADSCRVVEPSPYGGCARIAPGDTTLRLLRARFTGLCDDQSRSLVHSFGQKLAARFGLPCVAITGPSTR